MKPRELVRGDYVLATKWRDGDPCDHFVVGFFREMLGGKYLVEDGREKLFRRNGFSRCERIRGEVGFLLVNAIPIISDHHGCSVWYWKRHPKELKELIDVSEYKVGESGV